MLNTYLLDQNIDVQKSTFINRMIIFIKNRVLIIYIYILFARNILENFQYSHANALKSLMLALTFVVKILIWQVYRLD